MIGIGHIAKLVKAASGPLDPEQIKVLLEGMGLKFDWKPVPPADRPGAFERAWKDASLPGANMLEIFGEGKDGEPVRILLVLGRDVKSNVAV